MNYRQMNQKLSYIIFVILFGFNTNYIISNKIKIKAILTRNSISQIVNVIRYL
jgi:hypothetical protein